MFRSKMIVCFCAILSLLFLLSCAVKDGHSEETNDFDENRYSETNMFYDEEIGSLNELIENHYNANYGYENGSYVDFIFPVKSLVDDRESWYACVISMAEKDDEVECFLYYISESGQLYCHGNKNRLPKSSDFPKSIDDVGEYFIWYEDLGYYTDGGKRHVIDEKDISETAMYYRKRRNLYDERVLLEGGDAMYDFYDVSERPGGPYPMITIISSDSLNFE